MRLPDLFHDEHIYSALVRARYLSGQMFVTDKRFFELNALPYHWLRSQTPLCANVKPLVHRFKADTDERFRLRLQHTPLAPWLLSYPENKHPSEIEESGLRNNLEENPFSIDRRWKFCAECVAENKAKHGVSYWHMPHQLFGARACHRHDVPLYSNDELRYLKFTLPHHCLSKSQPLTIEQNWQAPWQIFIYSITEAIKRDITIVSKLKSEIVQQLNISPDIKSTHRPYFNELFQQMRQDIGEDCMSGLFSAYTRGIKSPPNILWITLTPFSRITGLRHPIYWLSILFWLREKLPTMRALLC